MYWEKPGKVIRKFAQSSPLMRSQIKFKDEDNFQLIIGFLLKMQLLW